MLRSSQCRVACLLSIATVIKIVAMLLFYQNVMQQLNGQWELAIGYTWDDYISSITDGEYQVPPQKSLSGVVALESRSYRPPVYPYLIYALHTIRSWGPLIPIVLFSVLTSLIAWFAFLIVRGRAGPVPGYLAMGLVFLFPMNLLKSASFDEAVVMMVLILAGIVILLKRKDAWYSILAGMLLGLAILTRYTALFAVVGLLLAVVISMNWRVGLHVSIGIMLVVSVWLIRNWTVYDTFVISTGGSRFAVITLTDDFIENFPEKSIDRIEIVYFLQNEGKYEILDRMTELEREAYFSREAMDWIRSDPMRLAESVAVKLKVFLPFSYYPVRGDTLKDLVYLLFYVPALLMLLHRLVLFRQPWCLWLWLPALGYAAQAVLFVMTSRHMYPVILMIYIGWFCDFASHFLKKWSFAGVPAGDAGAHG